jgi:uncharacterized protein involved in exopolysaccharide biosynthesis
MDPRYIHTLSRHRLLFTAPLVVAVAVALWFALGAPTTYESTTSLWFNNPIAGQSPVTQNGGAVLSPAAEGQQLLSELLTTRSFRIAVGHQSPLAEYLEQRPVEGWNPAALYHRLRGTGTLDDRITDALGPAQVKLTVAGPQVLAINLRSGSPTVSTDTLKELVGQFQKDRADALRAQAQASLAYLQRQVGIASKANTTAQDDLSTYVTRHPNSTPESDANLQTLTQTAQGTAARFADANTALDQATVALAAPLAHISDVRVLDAARVPTGPTSGGKKVMLAVVGGLFVGALISGLGVVFFTSREGLLARKSRPEAGADVDDLAPRELVSAHNGSATAELEATTVRGTIIAVRDEGNGRQTRPVWTLHQAPGKWVPLRANSRVSVMGAPSRGGVVRELRAADDGGFVLEVEITNRKLAVKGETGQLAIPPADDRWVGSEITLVEGRGIEIASRSGNGGWDTSGVDSAEPHAELHTNGNGAHAYANGASATHANGAGPESNGAAAEANGSTNGHADEPVEGLSVFGLVRRKVVRSRAVSGEYADEEIWW